MVTIYRVEHISTGRGPYRGNLNCGKSLATKHDSSLSHPTWPADGIYPDNPVEYISGFDSLYKLLIWFAGFMDLLVTKNYVIRVYHIDPSHVYRGRSGSQVAFLAKKECQVADSI